MAGKFKVGDLVQFDFAHSYGIIVEIKKVESFYLYGEEDGEEDILVCWSNGETFWCLDFVLSHVTSSHVSSD